MIYRIEPQGIGFAILRHEQGTLYAGPFESRERCEELAQKIGLTITDAPGPAAPSHAATFGPE